MPKLILSEHVRLRLLAMFLFYFAQGVPMGLFLFAIPSWLVSQGASTAEVGHVVAMAVLPWSLKLVDGFLMDRYTWLAMGRRRGWIILAQIVIACGLIAAAIVNPGADQVSLLAAIGFLTGFATAFQDVAVDSLAVDIMPEAERARASAIMFSGQLIGISATTALAGGLIVRFGAGAAYLAAATAIALIVLFAIAVRERPGEKRLPWSPGAIHPANRAVESQRWWPILATTLRAISRRPSLLFIPLLLTKGIQFGFMAGATPVLANAWAGWSPARITAVTGAGEFAAGLAALFIGGWLGDRLGPKRMLIVFLVVWVVFNGVMMTAVPLRSSPTYLTLVAGSWFTIDSMLSVGLIATAMRLCNRTVAATQFALYMATINFGTSAGAWLFGRAGDAQGIFELLPLVMSLELLGLAIMLLVPMTPPDGSAEGETPPDVHPEAA